MTTKAYYSIGKLVINTGLLENSIRVTLKILVQKKHTKIVFKKRQRLNEHLKTLRNLIKDESIQQELNCNENLLDEIKDLTKKRNMYVHSMFGMKNGNLIIYNEEEINEINVEIKEINEISDRISSIHRYFMDFIEKNINN